MKIFILLDQLLTLIENYIDKKKHMHAVYIHTYRTVGKFEGVKFSWVRQSAQKKNPRKFSSTHAL